MPHIIVKLYAGSSEEQKTELTKKIIGSVVETTECSTDAVSIAFEEFKPEEWAENVYKKDILNGPGKLYKTPGYDPFAQKEKEKGDESPDLTAYVRGAAQLAAKEDTDGLFNPMSWLDLELEDNPHAFNPYFKSPWDELSDHEKGERMMVIRRVL